MNRRQFLQSLLGALAGGVAAVPLLGPWLAPLLRRPLPPSDFVSLGPAFQLQGKQPKLVSFTQPFQDGWEKRSRSRSVWVSFLGPGRFRVFTPICPHLGCSIGYDAADKKFACPCHASRFTPEGEVLGGPSPRGMDELPTKIENGQLMVRWVDYRTGTAAREAL